MWAANYNRVPVIELLVKAGASVKAKSKVEDTPARDRADRAANQLRQRRVAALKAAEQPPRPAGAAAPAGAPGAGQPAAAQPGQPRPDSATTGRRPAAAATPARRDSAAYPAMRDSTAKRPDSAATRGAPVSTEPRAANSAGDTQQDSARSRAGQERALGYADLVGNRATCTNDLAAACTSNRATCTSNRATCSGNRAANTSHRSTRASSKVASRASTGRPADAGRVVNDGSCTRST
jgi:hypothetical protein